MLEFIGATALTLYEFSPIVKASPSFKPLNVTVSLSPLATAIVMPSPAVQVIAAPPVVVTSAVVARVIVPSVKVEVVPSEVITSSVVPT